MVRDGVLYKRREVKPGKPTPDDFELIEKDDTTGKTVGWVPVGDGPDDAIHRETFKVYDGTLPDGTYELVGPKINGNPDHEETHQLIQHGLHELADCPRDFAGLRDWLTVGPIAAAGWEGVVFWHPDGRMAKIKRRDFPKA